MFQEEYIYLIAHAKKDKILNKEWLMCLCMQYKRGSDGDVSHISNAFHAQVFWHSSAHILGEALERVYGGHLCYGPPIEEGFYYDMHTDGPGVSNLDFPGIEEVMKKITKEKQPFERLEMKKEDLMKMFKYNKFKVSLGFSIDTCLVITYGGMIEALHIKLMEMFWLIVECKQFR